MNASRGGSRIFSRGVGFSEKFLGRPNWCSELSQSTKKTLLWLKFLRRTQNFEKTFLGTFWKIITRPNCALDRSTILCLYVPGFQRQVFKHVSKCKWIPETKFQWIPHTYTCNVKFVGTFVLLRIPQQANIASCSGFRNCKWIPQNVSGIRKM